MIAGVIKEGHGRYLIPSEGEPGVLWLVELFPKAQCSCPGFGIYVQARGTHAECKHLPTGYEIFGRETADAVRAIIPAPA